MKKPSVFALAAIMVLGLGATSALTPVAAAGLTTRPPLGLQLYCLKHREECRGKGEAQVPMSEDLMAALARVNRAVNSAIQPRNEVGTDVWTVGASSGDCEDYVMTKRSRLIKMGINASALRVAYAKTRRGLDHAVLVVRTSQGDYVLDNLTSAIKPIEKVDHRIISMSGSSLTRWSAV